jgi:hypothetical protein
MTNLTRFTLLAALAATGFAFAPTPEPSTATAGPSDLTCAIDVARSRDGVTLRPVVTTDRPLTGRYRLSVTSRGGGGGSDIDQSGEFEAYGTRTVLGTVSLGGGGSYEARLTVTVGGRRIECLERIGGAI